MLVVTGAAGFIGANLVKGFNRLGRSDILVVDDLTRAEKIANLADCQFADYMDKHEFLARAEADQLPTIEAIFHEGACSDTMASDGRYVMENNYAYTRSLYEYCGRHQVQFIYASSASVYGNGTVFAEAPENECPLNAYAFSKWAFDNHVRANPAQGFQAVGLRYFNVYGPREQHKGRMASVAYHFFNQYLESGKVNLFEGSGGYADGEQRRDFVFVEDVVAVNQFLLEHPQVSGFLNVGTGQAGSFNDVALAVVNTLNARQGKKSALSLGKAQQSGEVGYRPMPEALHGKYQSFTEADISRLRAAGYQQPFHDVTAGVEKYVEHLWQARETGLAD